MMKNQTAVKQQPTKGRCHVEKCHEFHKVDEKYFCKHCGIDSLTAEKENLKKYNDGILYAYPKENMVGGWADKICTAYYGKEWKSVFGDIRQAVYFSFEGLKYWGIYYKSNSDIIRYKKFKNQ